MSDYYLSLRVKKTKTFRSYTVRCYLKEKQAKELMKEKFRDGTFISLRKIPLKDGIKGRFFFIIA